MVAISREATDQLQGVCYFGRDFALYRDRSGSGVLLGASCPRMGTNSAKNNTSYTARDGHVEGDDIRCAYHAWCFGPDGKCDYNPYYDGNIRKEARVKSWPVKERIGGA